MGCLNAFYLLCLAGPTLPWTRAFQTKHKISFRATRSQVLVFESSQDDEKEKLKQEYNDYYDPRSKVDPLPPGLTAKQAMDALGTSPRRIFLSLTSATGVALAGNLFGVTSKLLSAFPEEQVEQTGLDTYFPRGDYKRVSTAKYTFVIPKEWVADTSLALAKANARAQPLDLRMGQSSAGNRVLPDSAFGPPGGGSGVTNVSVIVSKVPPGFTIESLGSPEDAARNLAARSIAPEGSGRVATVKAAIEDPERAVYQMQFDIDFIKSGRQNQNLSVIACRGNELITLTIIAPTSDWKPPFSNKMEKIASSFHLK